MKNQLVKHNLEKRIFKIRGLKIMLDRDLAELYGIPTKALNQAVKRNKGRFPKDFMFRLTTKEKKEVVTICDHLESLRFSPVLPFAFTEYGALMLANVLNSDKAIKMSIFIVRTFMKLRETFSAQKEMLRRLFELERKVGQHNTHIKAIFYAVRNLMALPEKPRRKIGFHPYE